MKLRIAAWFRASSMFFRLLVIGQGQSIQGLSSLRMIRIYGQGFLQVNLSFLGSV
jgi:hypothetical protein